MRTAGDIGLCEMEIDLQALEHNYHELRRRIDPKSRVIASIKANAYGHGAVEIGRHLSNLGVFALATASLADAVAIRQAGVNVKIVMFAGYLPASIDQMLRYELIPTVYDMTTAEVVSAAASVPTPIYVKVDCGLGRLGVPIAEAADFIVRVASLPRIILEGVYTHLPFRRLSDREWAEIRLAKFDQLMRALAVAGVSIPVTQAVASSGVLAELRDGSNAVCPGHLLYGLSPLTDVCADAVGFRPVLRSLSTRLIHIARHGPDSHFGAGGYHRLRPGSVTGVVPVGLYHGGRNSAAGCTATMLIRGRRAPVLGVSLEYTTLDLTDIPTPEIGEEVILLGGGGDERITLDEMARYRGTGALELLMAFDKRISVRTTAK